MIVFPLANANASVISVTTTAATLLSKIDSAGSTTHAFDPKLDAVDITPEDGDIRIIIDDSTAALAPTTTKGFLVKQGSSLFLRLAPLRAVKVISTTGTVSCSLQIGRTVDGETTVITGGGGSITSIIPGTGATNLGKAEDAVHASGDTGVMMLGVRTDTPASLAGTTGDYTAPIFDSLNHQWTREGFVDGFVNNTTGEAWASIAMKYSATSTNKPTRAQNNSFATVNVKAAAGTLVGFSAINTTGSSRYVQFHNTATTPSAAATAYVKFFVPANSQITIFEDGLGLNGLYFDTGIAVANSSVAATYTAGSAGDILFDGFYI